MSKEKETKKDIQKAQPARVMSPFEEMDRLFEGHFPSGWMRPFHWPRPSWGELSAPFEGKMPKVDVIERDNEIVVKAELPGVDKKDLDISVTKNTVTIQGSTSHEEKEEKGDVYRCEISRGSYSRTLTLPAEVNEEKAKAKFKDGILELTLPKVEKAKRRTIKVE
ncbi:MAG: Hsp20/alpha crystallin family protein [Gammaproteobacteria bacterium]|jgi:HSP20 family protein|nr:Hsp20/alpha crystallin family protein [Gammaproteobacteria bacterium]